LPEKLPGTAEGCQVKMYIVRLKKNRKMLAATRMKTPLDENLFRKLLSEAEQSPRKRSHLNLHKDFHNPVQRVCIALKNGTYVRPHCHPQENKWEMTLVLMGTVVLLLFDKEGRVQERLELSAAGSLTGIEIEPNSWHTIFPLKDDAVILEIKEIKEGPYNPADPIDFAPWAPAEGDDEVLQFLEWAQHASEGESYTPETELAGRTYSLTEGNEYYEYIAEQVDKLIAKGYDLETLDTLINELVKDVSPTSDKHEPFEALFAPISTKLSIAFTSQLPSFLKTLSPEDSDQEILSISERGYHLRMLHIEVMNRVMQKDFLAAKNKVVILPHCLRDFRADDCQFEAGDVDYVCLGCTEECLINKTGSSLKPYPGYHLYISIERDLEKVFNLARQRYEDAALLGVACVPELYQGMRLSKKMGIPAQGVLLNYNRCRRWMGKAYPTSFNLKQLMKAAGIIE
jgi:cupin fold WbuC family metalloprotein